MSDEWGKTDDYDPWAVPDLPQEPKPPKEKKPKKPQGEKKPPRDKKPAIPDSTLASAAEAEGDAWAAEDAYDHCANPAESPEQKALAVKLPKEKKKTPADMKLPTERKPPRDQRPQPDNKSAAETASTSDAPRSPAVDTPTSPTQGDANNERKKSHAYHNPERVLTGGAQRDKLSEEELTERMMRMKEQNEKIKQRRMDILADEDAFKQTQESERIKQEKIRKEQEQVNRTREQNARRKMDKISSREWDEGKPSGDWKQARKDGRNISSPSEPGGRGRGGGGMSNRGRGRGRGDETSPAEEVTISP